MAGDEITAEWLGDLYAIRVTITTAPLRFSATSRRFRSVKVFNAHPSDGIFIGKFYATSAEFEYNALTLLPLTTMEFKYIDIYNLGYCDSAGGGSLAKLLGINQY